MADENHAAASSSTSYTTGRPSPYAENASPGLGMRRAATIDPGAHMRRRSTLKTPPGENPMTGTRRGSSAFSDYSLNDATRGFGASADDLFNPSASGPQSPKRQPTAYLPLIFALLPALAGVFFQNGASFFTDLILLSLAAVVLHWSVTQPWDWYLETQQIWVANYEVDTEPAFGTDNEREPSVTPSATTAFETLGEESEEAERAQHERTETAGHGKGKEPAETTFRGPEMEASREWAAKRAAASNELKVHEIMALAWCFLFPLISCYVLHAIRSQLSRPSEGLVSDYNLTIFLCAAEMRPVSHLLKMIRNRTLHIQRVVSSNPYEDQTVPIEDFQALSSRLDELEARAAPFLDSSRAGTEVSSSRLSQAAMVREINNTMQPEMDALNRAMRRYEKKLALLANQMDARLDYLDHRIQDTVALAAVAAKNSNTRRGLFTWLAESTFTAVMLPVQAIVAILTFPFRAVSAQLLRSKQPPPPARRNNRNGSAAQGRDVSDRIPSRLSRK
ncbi:hypothetical protein DL771_003790 [Monosporascus sp. 5C6A]|nr:hypothetical protein DL771_003790 [Monosporascus sp. 5C6A]